MKIAGSTVLLTGASGGLGGAIAEALHARGGRLVLSGRRAEVLAPLAARLDGRAIAADLSDPEDVLRLAREAGEVDILVANAALPAAAPLTHLSLEEVDRALEVNLRAPIVLARVLLEGMLARGRGQLVFISSTGGRAAAPGNPLYHATKFGLRGFSGALRIDLRGSGVGVSCVLPGFIREAGLFAQSGAELPPGVGTRSPRDVGEAVVRAIERNRAEVDVSSLPLRGGALFWSLAPDLASRMAQLLGSEQIASTYEHALREKR